MTSNSNTKIISTIQLCSSIIVVVILGLMGYALYNAGDYLFIYLEILPKLVLVLSALVPSIVLRVRHQSEAVEGSLIPLFLLFITLETFTILPAFYDYYGIYIVSYYLSSTLTRGFMLSAAMSLLFGSILNLQSDSISRINIYVFISIVASFIVSFIIPVDELNPNKNYHNIFFTITLLILIILANATYLLAFLKTRELYKIKRFLTCFFLSIGQFLILLSNNYAITNIFGMIFCITGAIMLCIVSPDGY